MGKEFPLGYLEFNGKIFDVTNITGRDIEASDTAFDEIQKQDFVIFYTGMIEKKNTETKRILPNTRSCQIIL